MSKVSVKITFAANRFIVVIATFSANRFFSLAPFHKYIMLIYNMKLISKWELIDRKWVGSPMLRAKS